MNYKERYSRQTMLPEFGQEGQEILKKSKALIVGVGGLGSPIALYLAAAGIGTIGLVDFDCVSISNLQRQILYTEYDQNKKKTDVAKNKLKYLNSSVKIETYCTVLSEDNAVDIIKNYDIVIDGCDNFKARRIIDKTRQELGIPYVFGSIGEFNGLATVFNNNISDASIEDIFPFSEDEDEKGQTSKGVLGPLPGVIGSIEAIETIKVLTGCGNPLYKKLLTVDLLTMEFNLIEY